MQSETFITKAMLIEKTIDVRKFIEVVHKINKNIETKEDKELLENIIRFDYECKLGCELTEKLIKDLEGDDGMLASAEMVWKEFDGYFIRGKRETMREIAKRMLEKNMAIDTISELTKLDEKEIKKLKL